MKGAAIALVLLAGSVAGCGGSNTTTIINEAPMQATEVTSTSTTSSDPPKAKTEDYFVTWKTFASYSPEFRRDLVNLFIAYNSKVCQGANPDAMFDWIEKNFVNTSTKPTDQANLAMYSYCVQILGNQPTSDY